MTDMAIKYETKIRLHSGYIRTIPGILKIIEIVLDIIVAICASLDWWFATHQSRHIVQFVSITAMLSTIFLFTTHLFNFHHRLFGPWVLIVSTTEVSVSLLTSVVDEFVCYCVFTCCYVIAFGIAAANGELHPSVAACAFFAFAATALYAVDTFFQFRAFRSGQTEMTTTTTASHNEEAKHLIY